MRSHLFTRFRLVSEGNPSLLLAPELRVCTANALGYVAGKVGSQAAQFNGTSSYVSIPGSVQDDFTVGLGTNWSNVTGPADTNQTAMPLSETDDAVLFLLVRPQHVRSGLVMGR